MTQSVIELNDHEIRVATDNKIVVRSPAAAIVKKSLTEVGQTAYRQSHLHPRETYQKFWYQLNQTKLRNPSRAARHHADLAYLHLRQILDDAGKPEKITIAIPGGFSNEQLALLLGIVQACEVEVIAVVDAAVAAAANCVAPGEYRHIEIQQHRTVITNLRVDDVVTRGRLDVVEGIGTEKIARLVVEFISREFLVQSRFDPLHQANTEQLLFNEFPKWLELLRERSEVDVHIDFRQTRFNARIKRSALVELLEPMYSEIRERLAANDCCLIGSRLANLPGLEIHESDVFYLPEVAVFEGCANIRPQKMGESGGLHLLTKLPATTEPSVAQSNFELMDRKSSEGIRRATHILCNGTAYPINLSSNYFSATGESLRSATAESIVEIWQKSTTLRIRGLNGARILKNGTPADAETEMGIGDRITIGESTLVLEPIHVVAGNAQ